MSSSALVTLTQGKAELTEAEALILAEMGEDRNAYIPQPSRVKIAPGGIGQYQLGDEMAKSFTAIAALSQIIRGFWPDQGTGKPPLCSSPDGLRGFFSDADQDQLSTAGHFPKPHLALGMIRAGADLPAYFECATCPMNQWGSDLKGGRGKGCKEMRRLMLLIDGWTLPALMSLPPTSTKLWDAYCSALAARKGAYFAVRTKFELDTTKTEDGIAYNVVKVMAAGRIDDMDQLRAVSAIRDQYRQLVSGMPIAAEEYETTGNGDRADEDIPF